MHICSKPILHKSDDVMDSYMLKFLNKFLRFPLVLVNNLSGPSIAIA